LLSDLAIYPLVLGLVVVVSLYVKLADRTSPSSGEQPFVNALRVEVVQAGHRPHVLPVLVLHYANHALLV
jgi:hypothetical protein